MTNGVAIAHCNRLLPNVVLSSDGPVVVLDLTAPALDVDVDRRGIVSHTFFIVTFDHNRVLSVWVEVSVNDRALNSLSLNVGHSSLDFACFDLSSEGIS